MNDTMKICVAVTAAILGLTAPVAALAGPGNCYLRADTGYSWSTNPDASATHVFVSGPVTESTLSNTWFVEAGFGCSWLRHAAVGSIKDAPVVVTTSGLRGEVMLGYHGRRDFHGVPPNPQFPLDPVFTGVTTVTLMGNLYYDFRSFHGLTPYIGAGIGAAFHDMDQVTFHDATLVNILSPQRQTNFAWQLMAGVSREIGNGLLLDVGYRYVDLGDVSASSPAIGHAFNLERLTSHEVKIGLRIPLWLR